jgi:hypothetical protein
MKKRMVLAALSVGSFAASADAAPFTAGNIAVYRVGTGAAALTTNATEVFVDEYTTAAAQTAPVQSIALPTAVAGSNLMLTAQGTATFEGFINTSADGRYLILTGYNTAVGTTTPATSSAATVNRVIGRIDFNGAVNTSTAVSDTGTGSIRSAISTDGTNLWSVGADGGVRFTTLGTVGTSTLVSNTDGNAAGNLNNLRHADIFDGQLLISTGSAGPAAINRVGTGTPTTSGQTMAGLIGAGGGSTALPAQFFMADLNATADAGFGGGLDTLYVASDGANALRKYSWDAGTSTWVLNGTVGANADDYRGLTGVVSGTTVSLYAIRDANTLVSLTDATGFNGAFAGTPTVLATAPANTAFRGVDIAPVPEPGSLALLTLSSALLIRRRRRTA